VNKAGANGGVGYETLTHWRLDCGDIMGEKLGDELITHRQTGIIPGMKWLFKRTTETIKCLNQTRFTGFTREKSS